MPPVSRSSRNTVALAALACALLLGAQCASANGAAAAGGAVPGVPVGGIAQVVFGLVAVLALVGAAAWLLKRFSGIPGAGSALIRIIGGASVGQRERVVLIELGDTWLLLGVAPGQVRTLHSMPKAEAAATPGVLAALPPGADFAAWLSRVTQRGKHG